jgi:drug/metabolite transporter (DMT)-like permease
MGITQIFYALALLNTEVVRAITLFYLNPVWTAILARLLLGEKLGGVGIIAMLFAFIGMALVLHTGFSLPLPQSAGDWYAILAGIAWATSVILLRFQPEGDPVALTVHALIWTGIGLLPVIWLAWDDVPAMALVVAEFWWLLPFVIGVLMTGVFASMWAVPKLSPNLVSLLYMTEISTAAVTAALFSNQPFTLTDGIGVALIALAGALTSIVQMARARTALRAKEDY